MVEPDPLVGNRDLPPVERIGRPRGSGLGFWPADLLFQYIG
ncbi:MAG: hypothetical protein Ct9H300mP16_10750 [Pseudomonadota bacterium]|nr:MAG: hypothetical protein Ct9H300mP16_10750 [Pseudomonadota bacterium]